MEFRDKLLSSELRHITDMMNMLSYELVIIQDFMNQQFGTSFKRFRDRHLLSIDAQHETVSKPTVNRNVTRIIRNRNIGESSSRRERDADPIDIGNLPDSNSDGGHHLTGATNDVKNDPLDESMQIQGDNFGETLNNNNQQQSHDDLYEESDIYIVDTKPARADPDFSDSDLISDYSSDEEKVNTSTKKVEIGGRKSVWKHFDSHKLPNGKKIAICKKCHYTASPVAKRLEKHYQRCVLGRDVKDIVSTPVTKMENSEDHVKKGKKPLGIVWTYFNKSVNEEGQATVTCKSCDRRVSNHATRMSKHLQNCTKSPVYETETV